MTPPTTTRPKSKSGIHNLAAVHAQAAPDDAKSARKAFIDSFAEVVSCFSEAKIEELLAQVPAHLVTRFDAARAELWLWDESSSSAYLVHSAGIEAGHRHDFSAAGHGAIGKVGDAKKTIENIVLSTFGGEDAEYAHRSGLTHISCYPLMANDKPMAIIA